MSTAVTFKDVNIIFGDRPENALMMVDQGKSRDEIGAATGNVLGVAHASLDIEEGEILVLMGLSGSGKSTLLRAVNGLAPVVRGEVSVQTVNGVQNPYKCNAKALRDLRMHTVSMVFQQFALLPWRTVADNVGFGLELARVPEAERKKRVGEQLELVNLTQWANRKVNELSGGMQQRVGLARAFATGAPILLMDEPFSALDPLIRTRLHDIACGQHADRVHVLDEIRDILVGRVLDDLLRRAALDNAAAFHDGDAIADAEGFVKVVADEQDGPTMA